MDNFKHYISICYSNRDANAKKVDLFEALAYLQVPEYASPTKNDSALIFQGYSSNAGEYARLESELDSFSSIFIDCDNDSRDPAIIEKWKSYMDGWDYFLYETASSTVERPKFRAIVPMDGILKWDKVAKAAIFHKFASFADPKASWFYAPTTDKISTIIDHTAGRWFPAKTLEKDIEAIRRYEELRANRELCDSFRRQMSHSSKPHNPDGWRRLPKVRQCLESPIAKDRDASLNAACYAMAQNDYKDKIPEFLDEVQANIEDYEWKKMKDKFRRKYR